jgi:hypothetical protein
MPLIDFRNPYFFETIRITQKELQSKKTERGPVNQIGNSKDKKPVPTWVSFRLTSTGTLTT